MNKKRIIYTLLTGLFLVLALTTRHQMLSSDRIYRYAERIETGLHLHQNEVQDILQDTEFLKRRLSANNKIANLADEQDLELLVKMSAAPYSIVFEKDGVLKFWRYYPLAYPK